MNTSTTTIPALPLRPVLPAAGVAFVLGHVIAGVGATYDEAFADARNELSMIDPELDENGETVPIEKTLEGGSFCEASVGVVAGSTGDHETCMVGDVIVTIAEANAFEKAMDAWEDELDAWLETVRPNWSLAPNFEDGDLTEDEYRDLLEEMARSLAAGNAKIRLTRAGTPVWADSDAPSPNLSCYSDRAIKEIDKRIGRKAADDARLRLIKPRQDELTAIASTVWDGGWKEALARELDVDARRVQRWAAGEARVPARILAEIKTGPIMARARAAARSEVDRLRRLLDEAERMEAALADI